MNDERGFKDLEGKLMNDKNSDINKQLSEFTKFINSNMGSMIGKCISNNLIDKLKEASNALGVILLAKKSLVLRLVDQLVKSQLKEH